jgi:hypothetical protein
MLHSLTPRFFAQSHKFSSRELKQPSLVAMCERTQANDARYGAASVVSTDIDAAVPQVVRDSGYPGRREWAEEYIRSANSDASGPHRFRALR